MSIKHWISLVLLTFLIGLTGCSGAGSANTGILKASGTISVTSVQVAPEISGKILENKVAKGDSVKTGDILFRLEDNLLQAQFDQANAAVEVAQANLDAAKEKLSGAQTLYDIAMQTLRKQDKATTISDWKSSSPDSATTGWYFQKDEKVTALKSLVEISQKNLGNTLANLDSVIKSASSQDFLNAEKRLNQAEQMHDITDTTLKDAKLARVTDHIQDAAQDAADAAQTELDAAKKLYDEMLPSSEASKVMDARAKVAVAEINLINTQNALDREQTGIQSLQVVSAQSTLDQADSAVKQANANLTQAQANLQVARIQLAKAKIISPISGVVLSNPVNAGEVVAAGATVFEIGNLDEITLDVYISENQYGQIKLGQTASVKVDSFPNKSFEGKVAYISDQAEFTPRTVQTVESRSTTVYKVEITIANPDHDLKAGMPADAIFTLAK